MSIRQTKTHRSHVTDPLGNVEGLNKLVAYSDEMIPAIGQQIGTYVDKNLIHGNADTRSEFAGRAVFEVASWLIGAGEAKAGIKAGSTGDDVAKLANYSDDLARASNYTDDLARASNYTDEAAEVSSTALKLLEGAGDEAAEAAAKSTDDVAKLADDLPGDGVHIKPEVDDIAKKASESGSKTNLLDDTGKFIDDTLENNYQAYIKRKISKGQTPKDRLEWKQASEYWTKESPVARGNNFNKTVREADIYDYHEIYLENGKRLDSYDPDAGEIISRKATDLDKISEETYRKYL